MRGKDLIVLALIVISPGCLIYGEHVAVTDVEVNERYWHMRASRGVESQVASNTGKDNTNFTSEAKGFVLDGAEQLNRRLEDLEKPEPFTTKSIQPQFITKAIDDAKNELFDYAMDPILEAFGVDDTQLPKIESFESFTDSIEKIQDQFVKCLDDEKLVDFGSILKAVLENFESDNAVDKLLNIEANEAFSSKPEDDQTCKIPNLEDIGLPDLSSISKEIQQFTIKFFQCLRAPFDEEKKLDLGFNYILPSTESSSMEVRKLQEAQDAQSESCGADDADESSGLFVEINDVSEKWGASLALSASLAAKLPLPSDSEVFDPSVTSTTAITLEAGYDNDFGKGTFGVSLNHPLSDITFQVKKLPSTCPLGYYCKVGSCELANTCTICPPGYYCNGSFEYKRFEYKVGDQTKCLGVGKAKDDAKVELLVCKDNSNLQRWKINSIGQFVIEANDNLCVRTPPSGSGLELSECSGLLALKKDDREEWQYDSDNETIVRKRNREVDKCLQVGDNDGLILDSCGVSQWLHEDNLKQPSGLCEAGAFCPEGSTSPEGRPVKVSLPDCPQDQQCRCKPGYYCPKGSTTAVGKPVIELEKKDSGSVGDSTSTVVKCEKNRPCGCPKGSFCPPGAKKPTRCRGGEKQCRLDLCKDQFCRTWGNTNDESQNQRPGTFKKYLEKIKNGVYKNTDVELGLGLSIQGYWNIGDAPWNGSNGFGFTIPLPFEYLPSVSFIFGAPPFHCPFNDSYKLSGLSFGLLDCGFPLTAPDFATNFKSCLFSKIDELKKIAKNPRSIKKRRDVSEDTQIGFSHSYDFSPADGKFTPEVDNRYQWCGVCETCSNCRECEESSFDDKTEEFYSCREGVCKERRGCSSRLLDETDPFDFVAASRVGNNTSRALQIADPIEVISEYTPILAGLFSRSLTSPFCIGPSCGSSPISNEVIQGTITAGLTENCGGVKLEAELEQLKLRQLLSVVSNGAVNDLPDTFDPVLNFGIDRTILLSLVVSGMQKVTLSARVPPEKAQETSEAKNVVDKVLDFIRKLQFEMYGTVEKVTGGFDLEAGVCVSIGLDEQQSCLDSSINALPAPDSSSQQGFKGIKINNGMRFEYAKFLLGCRRPSNPPLLSAFIEMAIGLRLCPGGCETDLDDSFMLEGSVRGEIDATPSLGGGLQQIGTYWEAFGVERLHLSDFLASAQFGLKFPVPESVELGGTLCIGLRSDCEKSDASKTIRAGAYVGFSSDVPTDNYVVAYVQELTFGNTLTALGMESIAGKLPKELQASGILPPITAPADCGSVAETEYTLPASPEEAAGGLPNLRLECVAYFAYSGSEKSIPGLEGNINAGISVAGRLLVQYGVLLDLSLVATFDPTKGDFEIDASVLAKLPKENPIATISKVNDVDKPARFYVAKSGDVNPSLAVMIDGQLNIDSIATTAKVQLTLSSEKLIASGDILLFGALKATADVELRWDMSYFKVAIDQFGINSKLGFIGLKDCLFEFKSTPELSLVIEGTFSVGDFDAFKGSLIIEQKGGDFEFSAEISVACAVEFKVKGVFKLSNIADSTVSEASIGASAACLLEIGAAVTKKIGQLADSAKNAVNALGDAVLGDCKAYELDCVGGNVAGALDKFLGSVSPESSSGLISGVLSEVKDVEVDCVYYFSIFDSKWGYKKPDGSYEWHKKPEDIFNQDFDASNGSFDAPDYCDSKNDVDWKEDIQGNSNDYLRELGGTKDSLTLTYEGKQIKYECEKQGKWKDGGFKGTEFLAAWTDKACYNKIIAARKKKIADVAPLIKKEKDFEQVKKENACMFERSQITSKDAFKIDQKTTYTDVFEVSKKPTETTDGEILLKYETKDFTNGDNGECVSTELKQHTCKVTVPKGPEGSLNRFIEVNLKRKFTECITGELTTNQATVPVLDERTTKQAVLSIVKNAVLVTTCQGFVSSSENPEEFLALDQDEICEKGPDVEYAFSDSNPTYVSTGGRPCGTQVITRTWTALDGCGTDATTITQTIYIEPEPPVFDVSELPDKYLTTSGNPVPVRSEYPTAKEPPSSSLESCGGKIEYSVEDKDLQEIDDQGCKSWTMTRVWTAQMTVPTCDVDDWPSSTLSQTLRITDDTKPVFDGYISDVRIPFFSNTQETKSLPGFKDDAANFGYGDYASKLVNKVFLSSDDTDLIVADGENSSETECATDGLASFTRTWTVTDSCSNLSKKKKHRVTIQHPPRKAMSVENLTEFDFPRSVGVEQSSATCAPEKILNLGKREYSEGVTVTYTGSENFVQNFVQPIKPKFTITPEDVTIDTTESPLPENTGQAQGTSFCGTPFEIAYTDSLPVKEDCGKWVLVRTWEIRPSYADCPKVTEESLVDRHVQKIFIEDRSPPKFIFKPPKIFTVPFLEDYGPEATGVPRIEDVATDKNIADLHLTSYPIILTYNDTAVSFPKLSDCAEEAMAIIERQWTAVDDCGTSADWVQTIRIGTPSEPIFGDASGYQVVTTGSAKLEQTDIAEELVVSGRDEMTLDNVKIASWSRTTGWDGSDPFKSANGNVRGTTKKGKSVRGVAENPSECTKGGGLAHSLVMETCPKGSKKSKAFLMKNSAGYGPEVHHTKVTKACDIKDGLEFAKEDGNLEYFAKDSGDEPIRFGATSAKIEAFSEQLAYGIGELLTGPKTISCRSSDQETCEVTETSQSDQVGQVVSMDNSGEVIELVGSGMIYNFFNVNLQDWFYRLEKSFNQKPKKDAEAPIPPSPMARITASGFVFVNIKYKTEVTLKKAAKNQKDFTSLIPAVRHDFQSSEEPNKTTEFQEYKHPQKFGDYFPKHYKHEDPWLSYDLSSVYANRWVPRMVEFSPDTLGQEYLLMNLPNPEIDNPDNVDNANKLAAIDLSFTDPTLVSNPLVWAGTLVVGNRHTSLRLKDTTWLGGQLILAGGKLELSDTSVLCGKYSANLACTSA